MAVQRDIAACEGRFMGPLHGVPIALREAAAAWCERAIAFDAAPPLRA
jgi:hypothetical protein